MFRRRQPAKPSELIRNHLNGSGSGFDLDDLVSTGLPQYEDVAKEVVEISFRCRTAECPIGIANPASFAELTSLVERLEAQGR
jgi:hypothetical protein